MLIQLNFSKWTTVGRGPSDGPVHLWKFRKEKYRKRKIFNFPLVLDFRPSTLFHTFPHTHTFSLHKFKFVSSDSYEICMSLKSENTSQNYYYIYEICYQIIIKPKATLLAPAAKMK